MKKTLLILSLMCFGFVTTSNAQSSKNEKAGLNYLQSKSKEFNINKDHGFKLRHVHNGAAGETLRFQHTINNVPVFGSEFVVNFSDKNEVVYSSNSYDNSVSMIDTNPVINKDIALSIANNALNPSNSEITFQEANLYVYKQKDQTVLTYRVSLQVTDKPGDWEIFVNAKTSEVISIKDVAFYHHEEKNTDPNSVNHAPMFKAPLAYVSGSGMVYNTDPLSQAHVAYGGNYVDNNDATNAQLDAARVSVVLPEIDLTAGVYRLRSTYADIDDSENPKRGLFTQATSVFNFDRSQDGFEAVNTFYHMDKSLRYIAQTLGVTCVPQQNAGKILYDPHGLNGQDNSHFIPSSDKIAFGEGCVDDAEDADVILHELGHGLHDWMTNGAASNLIGEGNGDYWAQSYSRSLNQWLPTDPAYHYQFSWDGHNACWSGRVTNYAALYPGGLVNSIHTDGQIWATALMKIYDVIGRAKMDKAFLEGLALTNGTSNQAQAAIAVRQAAINMNYPCADIKTMTDVFNATGYAVPAVAFVLRVPANKTVTAGVGNVYVLPNYSSECNAISSNCDAVITQSPVPGTSLAPGVYTITMTANSPTGRDVNAIVNNTFTLTVQPSLGVDEVVKNSLKIYPNPAISEITIKGDEIANQKMEIYNLLGQKVLEQTLMTNENKIAISHLSKGVYTIKLINSKVTVKFVKN